MVILLGKPKAARLYAAVEIAAYVSIVAGVAAGILTPWALLGLLIAGALADHSDTAKLIPSLGANIVAVLSTNVLLAIGYTIAAVV